MTSCNIYTLTDAEVFVSCPSLVDKHNMLSLGPMDPNIHS